MPPSPLTHLTAEGLERYLAEVRALPALTPAEEAEVFAATASGDAAARERIVLAHLGLVVRIAFQYSGYGLPLADIVAEGNLGLMRAAELFDAKFGVAFSTYASVWIKQRIHRAITGQARVVRIPVWRSQRLRKLDRLHADLSAELGRDADLADLAARLGTSAEALEKLSEDRLSQAALDEVPEFALVDGEPHPAAQLAGEELREEIAACLQGLDDTELQIVARKFGLLDDAPESYREMAPRFGKSREWIRRVGERAMEKVRASFHSLGGLPRSIVSARRRKAAERLRRLAEVKAVVLVKLSVWKHALMTEAEPILHLL